MKKPNPNIGVSFRKVNNYCGKIQYSYGAAFKDENGKQKTRYFYCGVDGTMTEERRIHAEKTAWHFRRLYCETLDPEVLSVDNTFGWQDTKFYDD